MRVRTTKVTKGKGGSNPPGKIIDHPEAWRFVELGVAEPIDAEAKALIRKRDQERRKRLDARWDALARQGEDEPLEPAPPPPAEPEAPAAADEKTAVVAVEPPDDGSEV